MSQLKNIKIIFLTPVPSGFSPGQRFRFEQYLSILERNGASIHLLPYLSERVNDILYSPGFMVLKIGGVLAGYLRRIRALPLIYRSDFVFIYREAAPLGPPVIEWFIARILRKKIIYDFDDAIWLTDSYNEGSLKRILKWRDKVALICKWSYKISCGNRYLCEFANKYNDSVRLIPTTIDTENLHNPDRYPTKGNRGDVITIGWTGTHSTLPYLSPIIPVIQSLANKYPGKLRFMAIANRKPTVELDIFHFVPWSKEREIEDLMQIDIGIMPLTDDPWSNGKCGFKALQYMALRIPAVASRVGANTTIIDDTVNGFLVSSQEEWIKVLERLINDPQLRISVGLRARRKVIGHYSVNSISPVFRALFE